MELRVGPDPAERAAAWMVGRLRDAVRRRGIASLAVSGGSTAPPLLEAVAAAELPWSSIEVWQVDERVAPDGHDDRNANQLVALASRCRVHLMPVTPRDLRAAARRYSASLPERFDIVHLGLGADGHTASWPPGEPDVISSGRSVELVADFHGRDRMTLTGRVVNAARSRLMLTSGESKRPMVERWLLADPTLPVTAVRRSRTWVFLDQAAAPPSSPSPPPPSSSAAR